MTTNPRIIKKYISSMALLGILSISYDTFSQRQINDSGVHETIFYKENIESLSVAHTLALLDKNHSAVGSLEYLLEIVNTNSSYENQVRILRDEILQASIYYSNKLRAKIATQEQSKELFNEIIRPKYNFLKTLIRDNSDFQVLKLDNSRQYYLSIRTKKIHISKQQFEDFSSYMEKVNKLTNLKYHSTDLTTRNVIHTIYNLSYIIKDLDTIASLNELPLSTLLSLATIESTGIQYAIGRVGELGIFQISPINFDRLMAKHKYRIKYKNPDDFLEDLIKNPALNASVAADILNDSRNIPFPQKVAAYKDGINKIKDLNVNDLNNHNYVKLYIKINNILDQIRKL